jgi:hypothetical protein
MKFAATTLALLTGLVAALPPASRDVVRVLPPNWGFEITSLKGPACPEMGVQLRETQLTYGSNTVDGSEIYYWFIAFPYLKVELGKTESLYCDVELQYREYKDGPKSEEGSDYLLRMHKNGTAVCCPCRLCCILKR